MSQSVVSESRDPVDVPNENSVENSGSVNRFNEFHYRPVPIAAPVALFLGFCSALGLLTPIGLGLGVFGTLLGALCLYRIRQAQGELGGKWLALAGCALSLTMLASGISKHTYNYFDELPEGYQRVNFTRDISEKGFVVEENVKKIHPEIVALDGEKVMVKGFMFPENIPNNITQFLLVKDNDQCCFGGEPELQDMIMVHMKDGMKAKFYDNLVSVSGVFRTNPAAGPEGLTAAFTLEATHFEESRF